MCVNSLLLILGSQVYGPLKTLDADQDLGAMDIQSRSSDSDRKRSKSILHKVETIHENIEYIRSHMSLKSGSGDVKAVKEKNDRAIDDFINQQLASVGQTVVLDNEGNVDPSRMRDFMGSLVAPTASSPKLSKISVYAREASLDFIKDFAVKTRRNGLLLNVKFSSKSTTKFDGVDCYNLYVSHDKDAAKSCKALAGLFRTTINEHYQGLVRLNKPRVLQLSREDTHAEEHKGQKHAKTAIGKNTPKKSKSKNQKTKKAKSNQFEAGEAPKVDQVMGDNTPMIMRKTPHIPGGHPSL